MFYEIGTDHGLPYDPFKVRFDLIYSSPQLLSISYAACKNARILSSLEIVQGD